MMAQSNLITALGVDTSRPFELARQGFQMRVFDNIQSAAADWQIAQPVDNRFLSVKYLQVLEQFPPKGFKFRYLVFYKDDRPVGVTYCQWLHFKAVESVQEELDRSAGYWQRLIHGLKQLIVRQIEFRTLVCGNILLTGPNGLYFENTSIAPEFQLEVLNEGLQLLANDMTQKGTKVTGIGLKDFGEKTRTSVFQKPNSPYAEFCFLPSMEMSIHPSWKNFDHYLDALSSKYRVRAKRAGKKAKHLKVQSLSAEEIKQHNEQIYALYQTIAAKATVNLVQLHPDYFLGLKRAFGEAFQLVAYWDDDKIVGFYTTLENGTELEAHFLGVDQEVNKEAQLYFNMLLAMVNDAILLGKSSIHFARTAMEIKSSVGAVGQDMYCYVRHRKKLPNQIFMPFLRRLTPADEAWVPRQPFKK